MDDDDYAAQLAAGRRCRNFLVGGTVLAVIALVALVATLLGVYWAAGFFGGSAVISVLLLAMWRSERRAGRDRIEPFQ